MPGVFGTELTRLIDPESFRITVRPRFGDLVNHDHFRFVIGARYGLTPQWELAADAQAYVSHGFGDIDFGEEAGFSRVQLGVKYRFEKFLAPYWDTVAGVKHEFPVGNPPRDLTDGLRHVTMYLTHSHRWESRPAFTTFINYGVDLVSRTDVAGTIEDHALDSDHWFFTPGVVWERGAFEYSLETKFASTAGFDSDHRYRFIVRPGVKWTLPPKFKFNARSRWVVGASVSAGYGTGGSDYGVGVRLQTDFDFKRLFRRAAPEGPAASR